MEFSYTIVTAADRNYYGLLGDLVDSLRDRRADAPIAVLDIGLDEAQRQALSRRVTQIATADWDLDFPGRAALGSAYKAFTARPFLPKYFPGYGVYLWIDSDAWVQDAAIIDLYLEVAWSGKLAVTPQIDRCYKSFYKWQRPRFNTLMFREYRKAYGWRTANRLGRFPIVNSGVVGLRGDAPHWQLWQRALAAGLHAAPTGLREQTALNYVVYHDRAPAGFLPAWCNWNCIDGPPMVDEERGLLVEPQPPHRPLGILHLVGPAKATRFKLESLQGPPIERGLHYSEWRVLRGDVHVARVLRTPPQHEADS